MTCLDLLGSSQYGDSLEEDWVPEQKEKEVCSQRKEGKGVEFTAELLWMAGRKAGVC